MTREILTIQLGHYSNFVGTHWWNLQEASFLYGKEDNGEQQTTVEVNHDVLFREGITNSKEITYTPRLILMDLHGALGSLAEHGHLYEQPPLKAGNLAWHGAVELHKTEPSPRNEFLSHLEQEDRAYIDQEKDVCQGSVPEQPYFDLDGKVKVWSDFLKLHLHPRSVLISKEFQHESQVDSFDLFGLSNKIWGKDDLREEYEDAVRCYVEESDNLQGFQVFVDSYNGFGGMGNHFSQYLEDEYGSKTTFVIALSPAQIKDESPVTLQAFLVNQMLTMDALTQHASCVVPASLSCDWRSHHKARSFPQLQYKADSWYHTSSILAAAWDTVSLPFRSKINPVSLAELAGGLTRSGRQCVALSAYFPLPSEQPILGSSLTPSYGMKGQTWVQSVVLRGLPQPRDRTEEQWRQWCQNQSPGSQAAVSAYHSPLRTSAPFPHLFAPSVQANGLVNPALTRPPSIGVSQAAVMGGLHSSSQMGDSLEALIRLVSRFKPQQLHRFVETGTEADDFQEALHRLQDLHDNYQE